MSQGDAAPAVRSEADALRSRLHAREIQRLLDAQADLERAIAVCTAALEEVRRELRGRNAGTPLVVH